MNCLIPGTNIKVLNKALLALSRISDELYVECRPEHLSLVAMNMNKTVYGKYNFHDVFFLTYEVSESDSERSSGAAPVTCKMHTKSLLNVFKQKMERKVETCLMRLERDGTKISIRLNYKHDVTMVHNLKLIDQDYLTIQYNVDDARNVAVASGHLWTQVLSNFQQADVNLSLQAGGDKMNLWNYDISVDGVYKGLRSQVVLAGHEFMSYKIGEETSLVMSLKPLRSAISFAEHFNLNCSLHFKSGGAPMIIVVNSSTFDMTFVLSTVNPDGSIATTASTTISEPAVRNKPNNRRATPAKENVNNMTAQDRAVLENVDWDDVDMNPEPRCSFTKVLERLGGDATVPNGEDGNKENEEDVVPGSPVLKRARIFQRCFDPTFHASMLDLGEQLAGNSDSDDDT